MKNHPLLVVLALLAVAAFASFAVLTRCRVRTCEADVPPLELTLAWNGDKVPVPGPVILPGSARRTKAYMLSKLTGSARTLTLKASDPDGTSYEALVNVNFIRGKDGKLYDSIIKASAYRPDGTLEEECRYTSGHGFPTVWTLFAADGKTKTMTVSCSDVADAPRLKSVAYHRPDGSGRRYEVATPEGLVWVEWEVDARGQIVRMLNGGNEYNPNFADKTTRAGR